LFYFIEDNSHCVEKGTYDSSGISINADRKKSSTSINVKVVVKLKRGSKGSA